ncbi:MAG: glycoside hydrolase family 2 protein, partial [Bacteroidota bacterium]
MRSNASIGLDGRWLFRNASRNASRYPSGSSKYEGTVPGTIHTDLMANRVIPDPFFRDNERDVQWIEDCDWEYMREFELTKEHMSYKMAFLIFEGVDTVADVFLNGIFMVRTTNMFVTYKIRIKHLLRAGKNRIRVVLRSPKNYAIKQERRYGKIFAELDSYRVHIRKAQYSFGWDWGPRLATSGIWKSLYIVFSDSAIVDHFSLHTARILTSGVIAELRAASLASGPYEKELKWLLTLKGESVDLAYEIPFRKASCKRQKGMVLARSLIKLANAELWWTHDLGSQNLYEAILSISDENGNTIDSRTIQVGFKEIVLERKGNSTGESFLFRLNDERVFVRGANWIPMDSFLTRPSSADYDTLLEAAKAANLNMLRVWGGGIYEREEFYRSCDRNGLLVWQDFMFACASYPARQDFIENVKVEALQNVRRLAAHPCIAIFCGNNESEWLWNLKTGNPVDTMTGFRIFKEILPEIVKSEAPGIPYWRSSPSGGKDPNGEQNGNHHQWTVWSGYRSYREYENINPRFVTEFGFQAPPTLRTIEAFTKPSDRNMQSKVMRYHNKQVEGTERLFKFAASEVRIAKDFEDQVL